MNELAAGRKIYNYRCYFCHGYSGDAKTLAATFLDPPPRSFRNTKLEQLSFERMVKAVREGRPGTAMKSFRKQLSDEEITQVVKFVREEFMKNKNENTRYHTEENGWKNHDVNRDAFPFALGILPLDTPWEQLSAEQRHGKQIFMRSCITCHDRAKVNEKGEIWRARPLSFPRNQYSNKEPNTDSVSSASPFALHEKSTNDSALNETEILGKRLFERNCVFCHGQDGSGKNWIGSFIEPHPRNLFTKAFLDNMDKSQLAEKITQGKEGSAMPSWKTVLSQKEISAIVDFIFTQKN